MSAYMMCIFVAAVAEMKGAVESPNLDSELLIHIIVLLNLATNVTWKDMAVGLDV